MRVNGLITTYSAISQFLFNFIAYGRVILRHFEDGASEAVGMTYNCCDNCRRLIAAQEAGKNSQSGTLPLIVFASI